MTEKEILNIHTITEIQDCIAWFQTNIYEIKKRDKTRDLSLFEQKVSKLIDFSGKFMQIAEENKVLHDLVEKSQYRLVICDHEYNKAKKELEQLKNNITL